MLLWLFLYLTWRNALSNKLKRKKQQHIAMAVSSLYMERLGNGELEKILLAGKVFDLKKESGREMGYMDPKHFFFQSAFIFRNEHEGCFI